MELYSSELCSIFVRLSFFVWHVLLLHTRPYFKQYDDMCQVLEVSEREKMSEFGTTCLQ